MLVLVTAINMPNFMLVSKSAQFAWNFELCRRTILAMERKGINWAKNLPRYCRVLNEEKKEELGCLSPFEVHYGRKSNVVTKASLENYDIDSCPSESLQPPKKKDLSKHHKVVKNIRKRARSYNRKLEKRMINKHMRRNCPPTEYKPGDKVLLRFKSRKGRIAPKRRHILKGRVVARNLKTSMYKVSFINPASHKRVQKWISLEDITSASSQEEKAKRKEQEQKKKEAATSKEISYCCNSWGRLEIFRESIPIAFDPPKDGNCPFSALCFFLRRIGIERSPETLRKQIVRYLREHPNDLEGIPLELFAVQGWAEYLAEMNKDGTYGDHIYTLQAASNIFNVQISVHSSLGVEATTMISPFTEVGVTNFNLGHFAEGQGEHYVCLEVEENAAENCSSDQQENQELLNEGENETEKAKDNNDKRENKTNGVANRQDQRVKEGISENSNDNGHQQRRSKETSSFDHFPNKIIAMIFWNSYTIFKPQWCLHSFPATKKCVLSISPVRRYFHLPVTENILSWRIPGYNQCKGPHNGVWSFKWIDPWVKTYN